MAFGDLYGHEKNIAVLRRALAQEKVAHAYLFSGLPGIGKKTLAMEWIKAINCQRIETLQEACGECGNCRKISHGTHSDVVWVRAEGQFIRIASIRQIQILAAFKPLEGRRRAFLIDEADRMNDEAASALLKMLEEPTLSNILILITSKPYALPQTILSRCQHLRFNPLQSETVRKFLVEKQGMDATEAALLAGLSGGSIGRALELHQQETLTYRARLLDALAQTRSRDLFSLMRLAALLGQSKGEISRGLHILKSFFRDVLVYQEVTRQEMLVNQDIVPLIAASALQLSGDQILGNLERIEEASDLLDQNMSKSLTLETMAFKLHYPSGAAISSGGG